MMRKWIISLFVALSVFLVSAILLFGFAKNTHKSSTLVHHRTKRSGLKPLAFMICINQQFHFSVEAFVREEINTMDHSDLFLDIFINDDFTQYGGISDLVLPGDNNDATDTDNTWHQGSSSVVQPLPPHAMIAKSRFVRSVN